MREYAHAYMCMLAYVHVYVHVHKMCVWEYICVHVKCILDLFVVPVCTASPVSLPSVGRLLVVAGTVSTAVVAGLDTLVCVAAVVGMRMGAVSAEHGESSLALHVATASVSTHRRLVTITLLAEHLVALCRQQCVFKLNLRYCIVGILLIPDKLFVFQESVINNIQCLE